MEEKSAKDELNVNELNVNELNEGIVNAAKQNAEEVARKHVPPQRSEQKVTLTLINPKP